MRPEHDHPSSGRTRGHRRRVRAAPRAGNELVARSSRRRAGGRGLISLAGMMLEARVPPGSWPGRSCSCGDRARRRGVASCGSSTTPPSTPTSRAPSTKLAGELARAATATSCGPRSASPTGRRCGCRAARRPTIHVDPEPEDEVEKDALGGRRRGRRSTLHCPELGAIEVRLRIGAAGVRRRSCRTGRAPWPTAEGASRARRRRSSGQPAARPRPGRPARCRLGPGPVHRREGAFDGYA